MIPLADAPALSRGAARAWCVRLALTLAIALLAGTAIVLAARSRSGAAAAAPSSGRSTEIVVDVSGSVTGQPLAAIRRTLRRFARAGGNVGLVLFSDVAEEALPPGTPASQLPPFASAFRGQPVLAPAAARPDAAPSPWYPSFSGGTRISTGLATARQAIRRDAAKSDVLLVSDLGDAPSDRPALRRELLAYERAGLALHVVVLPNALSTDRQWFLRLEGAAPFADALPTPSPAGAATRSDVRFPLWLALAAGLLALVLAAEELVGRPLRFGVAR